MKINTYSKEITKKAAGAGASDDLVRSILRLLGDATVASKPGVKSALKALDGTARDISDLSSTIMPTIRELLEDLVSSKQALDEAVELAGKPQADLVEMVARKQQEIDRLTDLKQKHLRNRDIAREGRRKAKESYDSLQEQYTEAIRVAGDELTDLKAKVKTLDEQVLASKQEVVDVARKLQDAELRNGKMAEDLAGATELLAKETAGREAAETALDALRKEHGELVDRYKALKDRASELRTAADEAAAAGDTVTAASLSGAADATERATVKIKRKITRGDPDTAAKLDEAVAPKPKPKPEEPAPAAGTKPDAEGPTPKLDPEKEDIVEELAKGDLSTGRGKKKHKYYKNLNDAERRELLTLRKKDPLTSAERKRLKQLEQQLDKGVPLMPAVARWGSSILTAPVKAARSLIGPRFWLATIGGVAIYWYFFMSETDAQEGARKIDELIEYTYQELAKVSFKSGSDGEIAQKAYLETLRAGFGSATELYNAVTSEDKEAAAAAARKIMAIELQTSLFLEQADLYAADLASTDNWASANDAAKALMEALLSLHELVADAAKRGSSPDTQQGAGPRDGSERGSGFTRPEPDPNDKGIDVLGERIYLSQYPEVSSEVRSAAPSLIKRVLLSPAGLSFWDPEGKWGGGYLRNDGTIADQVMKHVKFFMNPRSIDSDWAYGPITSPRKLRKFIRKNYQKPARNRSSGYKSTRREYRRKRPDLKTSANTNYIVTESHMNNRQKRLKFIEKLASSTNRTGISTEIIEKYADSISKEFYQDALRGLDDQYAKSYYTGLKSMYDQKLGGEKADYKSLYEPNGGTGTEILQASHPKTVDIADAKGRGGVVENVLEQQRHDIGVALSAPTGNFRGKHANLVDTLIKIANTADENNHHEISEMVDNAIEDIVSILKS